MIDYINKHLFLENSIRKELIIQTADGSVNITNSDLHSEKFELTEALCSENRIVFGSCESSMVKFTVSANLTGLVGKWLNINLVLNNDFENPFLIGEFKVHSDKPESDRTKREIVAHDAMYDIINAEMADWYNSLTFPITLKQFRDNFFTYLGVEQEDVTLVNDSMIIEETVKPSSISGKTVITSICEINGCFGHIGRDGKFHYIFLQEMIDGLYPSDTLYPGDGLYPTNPVNTEQIKRSQYISSVYEDFVTEKINKLQIRQEEDDIGCIYGDGDNCYIVQDNFLVYGKSSDELNTVAKNLYPVISNVCYRPAHVESAGNPCLEVGDGIRLVTANHIIRTYILQRTLKGIQSLRDVYDAEGEQYLSEKVNSVHDSIIQLRGKTNKLSRTIEETRSEITDIENGLSSRITQNTESISAEVLRASKSEGELSTKITQTAEEIQSEVTRAKNSEEELNSKITQNAESITSEVARAKKTEEELSSKITQSANEIRLEVTQRTSVYNEEVNTLQGGMDGNIDLSFFDYTSDTVVTTVVDKQCVYGESISQDIALPSGTYLLSYEWLRTSSAYRNADVYLYDLSTSPASEIYVGNLGYAWPETNVWHKESFQFTLKKTTRVSFSFIFSPPWDYPDRINDLYLTNMALYGTAQAVSDAIVDMKTELLLQHDQISAKVEKSGVVSAINMTPETITISANKIDLEGLVTATELVTKFATISSLNAQTARIDSITANYATINSLNTQKARIDTIEANYISANTVSANYASIDSLNSLSAKISSIESDYISASTVKADYMEVANWTSSGYIKAAKINVNDLFSRSIIVNGSFGISGISSFSFENVSIEWGYINGVKCLVAAD